jgi:signal transduction histidine kinase
MLRRAALRLGAQAALTVMVIVALLAGVAYLVVQRGQQTDAQNLVRDTAERADDVNDPPTGVWMVLRKPAGQTETRNIPAGLPYNAALARVTNNTDPSYIDIETLTTHGHEYLVRTQRRNGATLVQVALDLHANDVARDRLLTGLLLSGAFGLVLAALAGVWLGLRAVGPLSDALALQRRFVSDASHELRTPLTLLSTRAQLVHRQLRGSGSDPALLSDVDGLVEDARHLTEILDDLLLAADPGSRAPVEPIDVGAIADEVTAASAPSAQHRGVTIHCTRPARPALVSGAPASLRRALNSLVDNAIRHANGAVEITVTDQANQVVVEVRDDGPGIDPDLLPRLFDRFATALTAGNDERTNGSNGDRRRYGLGLALVSEIADRHRGDVAAQNADGGGAVLRLTLPAAR